jgi:hypothetical protein
MRERDVANKGEPETAAPTPRKRGVSLGAVITLVVGCAIVFPTLYYWKDLSGLFQLQAWSKAGPRQAVDRFGEALRSGDAAAMEGMVAESMIAIVKSPDGAIQGFKSKLAPMAPVVSVEAATPLGPAAGAAVKYRVVDVPLAMLSVPNAVGGTANYSVTRRGGRWLVAELMAH